MLWVVLLTMLLPCFPAHSEVSIKTDSSNYKVSQLGQYKCPRLMALTSPGDVPSNVIDASEVALHEYEFKRKWPRSLIEKLRINVRRFNDQTDVLTATDENEKTVGTLFITYAFYDFLSETKQIIPVEGLVNSESIVRPANINGHGVLIEFRSYFLDHEGNSDVSAVLHFDALRVVRDRLKGLEELWDKKIILTYGDEKSRAMYWAMGFRKVPGAVVPLGYFLVTSPLALEQYVIRRHFSKITEMRNYDRIMNLPLTNFENISLAPHAEVDQWSLSSRRIKSRNLTVKGVVGSFVELASPDFPAKKIKLSNEKNLSFTIGQGGDSWISGGIAYESIETNLNGINVQIPAGTTLNFRRDGRLLGASAEFNNLMTMDSKVKCHSVIFHENGKPALVGLNDRTDIFKEDGSQVRSPAPFSSFTSLSAAVIDWFYEDKGPNPFDSLK